MKIENVGSVNYTGKFVFEKSLKRKALANLNELMQTEVCGASNEQVLKKMPFDVAVFCHNPTKKAIHPRYTFVITDSKPKKPEVFGFIHVNTKNKLEDNVTKIKDFILDFDKKNKEVGYIKPSKKRDDISLARMIISGFFNKK